MLTLSLILTRGLILDNAKEQICDWTTAISALVLAAMFIEYRYYVHTSSCT